MIRYLFLAAILVGCGDNIHPPEPGDPGVPDVMADEPDGIKPGDDLVPDAAVDAPPDADDCDDHDDVNCHWHHGHWHCDKNDHEHDGHWHQGHLDSP